MEMCWHDLNDFRQYYNHLLPLAKKNEIKENIINSLKVASFNDIEELYITLLNRLGSLFEYLVLGYTPYIVVKGLYTKRFEKSMIDRLGLLKSKSKECGILA